MAVSAKQATFVAMLIFLALFLSVACKPEYPPVPEAKTGALLSPLPTPLTTTTPPISSLPTPIVTSTSIPTPWPPDFTPEPTLTPSPTPEGIPYIITDPVNRFSMTLLPGWYAYTPDAKAIVGVTTISNYDMNLIDNRPPGGLSIQIGAGPLARGQPFEQWVSDRIALETSPESGAFGVTITEPQPYTLGRYQGVSFVGTDPYGVSTLEIDLLSDGRVVSIGLRPDSPAFSEALLMLSTIEISP